MIPAAGTPGKPERVSVGHKYPSLTAKGLRRTGKPEARAGAERCCQCPARLFLLTPGTGRSHNRGLCVPSGLARPNTAQVRLFERSNDQRTEAACPCGSGNSHISTGTQCCRSSVGWSQVLILLSQTHLCHPWGKREKELCHKVTTTACAALTLSP